MRTAQNKITQLLKQWSSGDESALDELVSLVYDELRRLASYYLRHQEIGHTLQATALVNEAFIRLMGVKETRWENRAHFFAVAAKAMRQIIIDHARSHKRLKRGGGQQAISIDGAAAITQEQAGDMIALDEALNSLAAIDERKGRVVELRFFGGLNTDEIAEVLKISAPTVQREWRMAKAWLYRELKSKRDDG
jgi:RNA polymerase sigma-70 factor (ECF subfamily)